MSDYMDASAGPVRRRGNYHKKYDTIDEIYWVLKQEAKALSLETAVSIKELAALMKRSGNLDKPPAERTLSELLGRLYRDSLYICSDTTEDRHFPWKLECVLQPHQGRLIPRIVPRVAYNPMELEPYAMLWSNGYYYLAGHHQKLGLMNLRVDCMVSVTVLAEQVKSPSSFEPIRYRDSVPVMYAGLPEHIVLRCRTKLLNAVVDFFGASVHFFDVMDDYFSVHLHILSGTAQAA